MGKNNLGMNLLDIGIGTVFAGQSISIIEASPFPGPVQAGLGGVIGGGLLKKTGDKLSLEDIGY